MNDKVAHWRATTFRLIALWSCWSVKQFNGACAHYVMVSKFQWKPFWLATQRDPQNDQTATPNRVNYGVFAQAPYPEWVLARYSLLIPFPHHTSSQFCKARRFGRVAPAIFIFQVSCLLENGWGNQTETSCFAKLTAGVMRKRYYHSNIITKAKDVNGKQKRLDLRSTPQCCAAPFVKFWTCWKKVHATSSRPPALGVARMHSQSGARGGGGGGGGVTCTYLDISKKIFPDSRMSQLRIGLPSTLHKDDCSGSMLFGAYASGYPELFENDSKVDHGCMGSPALIWALFGVLSTRALKPFLRALSLVSGGHSGENGQKNEWVGNKSVEPPRCATNWWWTWFGCSRWLASGNGGNTGRPAKLLVWVLCSR